MEGGGWKKDGSVGEVFKCGEGWGRVFGSFVKGDAVMGPWWCSRVVPRRSPTYARVHHQVVQEFARLRKIISGLWATTGGTQPVAFLVLSREAWSTVNLMLQSEFKYTIPLVRPSWVVTYFFVSTSSLRLRAWCGVSVSNPIQTHPCWIQILAGFSCHPYCNSNW